MPLYKLNGKTYNIPDDVVSNFEKDNPDATIGYSVGDKKYEIPVSKRDGFLQAYPKAVLTGTQQPTMVEQTKEANENATKTTPTYTFSQAQLDSMERTPMASDTVLQQGEQFRQAADQMGSRAAENEEVVRAKQGLLRDQVGNTLPEIEQRLDSTYNDAVRRAKEAITPKSGVAKFIHDIFTPERDLIAVRGVEHDIAREEPEVQALTAAKQYLDDSRKMIEAADRGDENFFKGAARGFGEKFMDLSTWDFGITELENNMTLRAALDKADRGEELTDAERSLLDAAAVKTATDMYFGSYLSRGYKAGSVTAESIPFMIEMAANPLSATGKTAASKMLRYTINRFGRKAATSGLGKAGLTVARGVGDIAGAAGMSATTGAVRVAADAERRQMGDIQFDENPDADRSAVFTYGGHTEGDDYADAWRKAFLGTTIENYSEMVGAYFAPALNIAGKGVRKGLDKIGLKKVNEFVDNVKGSDLGRLVSDFEGRTQWNGTIGEYAEEVAGGIMNALLVGDQTLDTDERTGVFNLDNNIDTFLGVSLMGGFFSAIKTAGYRTPKYRARQDMKAKDDAAAAAFGNQDKWGKIRNTIAFGTDEDVEQKVKDIVNDADLTPEQRQAALEYVKAAEMYKGMLKGEEIRRADADPLQVDAETSFDNGYGLSGDQERNDAKNMLDYQRQRISEFATDETLSNLDADPVGTLNAIRMSEAWTAEELQVAIDYVNAKATYDGMIQRVRDDIDGRIATSDALIESRQHHDDGMIHPATMKTDDRKVYVIGGTLVMNEDGSGIDREASLAANGGDGMVLVRDAGSGDIMPASVEDFLSVDEPLDAAQEKEAAQEAIRQQYAQEAANKIDGVLPFNNGDTYQVVDDQGQQHTVTVIPTGTVNSQGQVLQAGDGEVVVSIDGAEPVPYSREAIQQMFENANLARLQQYEQEQAAHREEQAAAEREANRPVYNINDEVTLQTEEGTVRGSITAEANEDGLIEVYTEQPIGGKKINLYNRDQLDGMVVEHNGSAAQTAQPVGREGETQLPPPPTDADLDAMLGSGGSAAQTAQPVQNEGGDAGGGNIPEQRAAIERIPIIRDSNGQPILNKKGKPQYVWHEAPVADTADALTEQAEGSMLTARDVSTDMVSKAKAELEKVRKQTPKGDDPMELIESRNAIRQAEQQAQAIVKYWQDVNQEIQRRMREEAAEAQRRTEQAKSEEQRAREAEEARQRKERQDEIARQRIREQIERDKAKRNREYEPLSQAKKELADDPDAMAVLSNTEPRELDEWVSSLLRPHSLLWLDASESETGLQSELGLKRGDMQRFMTLLGTKENGAKSFGKVVLDIYENLPEGMKEQYTDQDVRNVLLGMFQGFENSRQMMNLAAERRIAEARSMYQENIRRDAEAEMETWAEFYHLTPEEREQFEDYLEMPPTLVDEEIINQIIAEVAETQQQTEQLNNNDYEQEEQNQGGAGLGEQPDAGGVQARVAEGEDEVQPTTVATGEVAEGAELAGGTEGGGSQPPVPGDEVAGGASGQGDYNSVGVDKSSVQGTDYSEEEILNAIRGDLEVMLEDAGLDDVVIKGMALHGSRKRGDAREDSDLDVVVEYEGNASEDGLFNLFNETPIEIDGIRVDVNPITRGKSGTLEQYMERSRRYDEEKRMLGKTSSAEEIASEEAKVDTNPTEGQKEAGNYQKGHIRIDGYDITIENPKGSVRSGFNKATNTTWETVMHNTYGYIKGTEGVDGDHIDVFLSDNPTGGNVFVVDQVNTDGSFDEHKVMYGFGSAEEARAAYLSNYEEGWQGLGAITEVSREEFKKWVNSSHRKTKPFAEYKSVKPLGGQNVSHIEQGNERKSAIEPESYEVSDKEFDDILGELDDIFNGGASMMDFFDDNWGKGERQDIGVAMDGETTLDHVRELFDRFNTGEHSAELKALAHKVFALVKNLNLSEITFSNDNEFNFGQQGLYASSVIRYRHNYFTHPDISNENKAHVLLHELIHACTMYAIRDYEKGGNHLSEDMKDAVKTLVDVYEQIKDDGSFKGEYGISDVKEMVAELSSPQFRAKMQAKKLWKKVVGAIKQLFGIKTEGSKETSAFSEASSALDYLLDNFDGEAYYLYSGRRATMGQKNTAVNESTGQSGADTRSGSVGRSASHSPAATLSVSFDAAKVRNFTQKAKRNIKNFLNGDNKISSDGHVNQVLGNLRRFFGMSYAGNSNYVVYDTPAGRLAFRLANHNARGDNFKRDNAQKNISVYVALEDYEQPGSSIPFTEYRISQEDFERHKDEFISSLVESVGNALNTGEFTQPSYTTKEEYGPEESTPFHEDDFFANYIELTPEQKAKVQTLGTRAAMAMIERGTTKFEDFAKAMVDRLGDNILPFLKSFYNGARDFPGFEDYELTPYEDVRRFDVLSLSRKSTEQATPTVFEKAEEVTKELEVERQAEVAKGKLTEQEEQTQPKQPSQEEISQYIEEQKELIAEELAKDKGVQGTLAPESGNTDSVIYPFMEERISENLTSRQFDINNPSHIALAKQMFGDTGLSKEKNAEIRRNFVTSILERVREKLKEPVGNDDVQKILDIAEKGSKSEQKRGKATSSKKKSVSLQQEPNLFGSFGEDATHVESLNDNSNGHARTDAVRSEGLPADGTDSGELGLRADGKGAGQESGRTDRRGAQGGVEPVRQRLHDGLRPSDQLASTPSAKPQGARQPLERPNNPKNTHNNHAERGKDYAPRGVDARIDANIKAIELMKQLMDSGEQATPEQMAVLRQFSGWGGLGKAFSSTPQSGSTQNTAMRLRELLGEEAYQQANMSRNSAYYTPANVIDALWDIARAMGFKGGRVLEGSAGIGNILGLMPTDMSERSDIHAVEIDQTTGNILSLLYPDAKVDVQGFEATQVENGSVDLAITNVPFVPGMLVPKDTSGDSDLSRKFRNSIQDFCIAKNVRKLREGGIGIFITSRSTLDDSARLREWVIQEGDADVVGAFRLNNETFGGTGATSDIIVIRKRVNGKKSPHAIDVLSTTGERTAEYDTGETKKVKGEEIPIIKQLSMDYNSYFVEHPEMMGGEMHFNFEMGETRYPTSRSLFPVKGKNQADMLKSWSQSFDGKDWGEVATVSQLTEQAIYEELGEGVKEGSMVVSNGQLCIAQRGKAVPLAVNANKVKGHSKVECFEAYQGIKKALSDLLQYQTDVEDDSGLQPLLKALNKAYDDFVKTYGHLHKNTSISFLKSDVDFANILALEKFSERGDVKTGKRIQEFGKTDIFSQRVVEKEKAPEPTNVKDGIIASIYVHGRVDVPWIVEQLNRHGGETAMHTEEEVKAEIVRSGLGFENPVTRQMEVSYEYLSGNVREKLAQAQANNADGQYDANIKALEKVVPMDIPAHLIDFSIGSSWIDPKLYEEYVKEKTDIDVTFTSAGGTWFMRTPYSVGEQKNRAMGVVSELLHKTIMGTQLIEAAMQNKTITVSETHKKWDGSTETITDKEATQACSNKIDEIRQDFKEWARAKMQSDPAMSERIERIYNDMFNNYVPKSIPMRFVPEYFGGATHSIKLRPHQAQAVIRGTTQPLLLAHEVGSGKTYTLISTAMEMRRLGTARKPMIVVQNATVGQFVEDAKELYPGAKVLTIEEADRTAEGRRNFYAKIKYNDWDMIVVPQSVFERIPDSEERQMRFVQDKIEEKMLVLEQMRDADPDSSSWIVKQAEKEINKLEDELAGLTDSISSKRKERDEKKEAVTRQNAEVKALEMLDRQTDDVENFDDMGIDAILVDEAHEYKHLGFATAMQRGVKGVDPSYSKKAQGVYLKTQAVLEKNNGRNVVFATGTPISNTAAEIWTFMRYLMPADTMKEYGIYYFDDFVRNFGNLQQMLEFTTSGKFKENNRFAGYVNLPELVRIWAGVADTVLNEDVEKQRIAEGGESKIPEMEDGKATDIYLPQTRALRSVMKYVKKQLADYEAMSGKEKKENSHIPLTMYGIAKAAAVDARLVVSDAADEPQSKTNEAVRQTLKSLRETESYNGTVALFADNYQNKRSGFNLYEDIREKLIAQGVPAEQIVVMKSGMSVKKKLEIFDKVNRGEIRVIMGSTFTLGTGVNIQERLHTLIHLDAPNRPMDYTQRNGRILRQGNLHKEMGKPVRVLRFGVEDSLDVTAYQRLKTKGAIADSIMNGKQMMSNSMENRALEEEEDVFGDTVAQLSGSEYAMLKNQAEKDVRKYEAKKKQYQADQTYCHNEIPRLEGEIGAWKEWLDKYRKNLAIVEALPQHTEPSITVGKQTFPSIEAMADFIKEYNKSIKEAENDLRDNPSLHSQTRRLTVNVGGIDFVFTTEQNVETKEDQGTLFSAVRRKMTYSCEALGLTDVPVHQSLLREGLEDIVKNVISGQDFREGIERSERIIDKNEKSLAQVRERHGKPFEFEKELEQAHERFDEYSELMKKELEEKEKKYAEMDADVEEASDISEADEADDETEDEDSNVHFRDGEDDVESINEQFNKELQMQIDGTLPQGHIYDMGMPSDILLSTGIANVPIQLNSTRLESKSSQFGHDFALSEIKDLVKAINDPVAIFAYGDKEKAQNIIVEIQKEGNNFVVGLSIRPSVNGRVLEVNSIRNVFPKKNAEWLNWINQGKLLYVDKEKIQNLINQQRTILADVEYLDLDSAAKVVENFENPKLSEENLREREGDSSSKRLTYEESLAMSRRAGYTKKQHDAWQERAWRHMHEAAESTVERLGLGGRVTIMETPDGLKGRKAKAKGWFDAKTGKIVVVLGNHHSVSDVVKTILHEGVAHYGLRKLFGQHFDQFLDNVYQYGDESVRREIVELAKKHGWDFREATEEYLARLAEDTDFERATNQGWWSKIKSLFLDMLHHIGLGDYGGAILTNNELRYILWRSYENMAEPGRYRNPFREAEDISMQMRLGVGSFDRERARIHSLGRIDNSRAVAAEAATMSQRTGQGVLFRDGESDGTREAYDKAVNTGRKKTLRMTAYNFREAFQDALLSVRKLQEVVEKKYGVKLSSHEDAWKFENALSSINMQQTKKFVEKLYEPMMKIADNLLKDGATVQELNEYLICKHGLERNRVFAERDYAKYQQEHPDGEKTFEDFRRDYSGLTAITGKEDLADIEAEALKRVQAFEKKHGQLCSELWDAVNKATKWTLEKSYQSGMMSKDTYEKVHDMFAYYIPLRGWDADTAEDVYDYMMSEWGVFNGTLKNAEGRTSLADDPLATIGNMGESAILQGNRNLLKRKLLNMAMNYPTDVCSVRDMWVVENAKGEWVADFPQIPEDATADEVAQILADHESDMESLAAQGKAKRQRNGLDIEYRINKRDVPEHAVVAYMNGRQFVVYINGNPRAAQAINGRTGESRGNSEDKWRKLVDFVTKDTKRYYSSAITQYSPNFAVSNIVRDLGHSIAMTYVNKGVFEMAKFVARLPQSIAFVLKNQAGVGGNTRTDKYFKEFVENGGVTGYAHLNDVERWKADNAKRWARLSALQKVRVSPVRGVKAILDVLGWLSETLELTTRFNTYQADRRDGKDVGTSIKAAKDITVNFNKKGSEVTPGIWGAVANTLRFEKMLFNPIVQGLNQFFEAGKAHPVRFAIATLHLPVLGAMMPYANMLLVEALAGGDGDDDKDKYDYWLQNEYTRRNNVLIFTGKGYIKIPIAPGFRELYGMGEAIATRHFGKADDMETAKALADQLRTVFSIEGQAGYSEWSLSRFLLPEHMGTVVDVMNNENFTGGTLYNENIYREHEPEYQKAKQSTWSPFVSASKQLNEWAWGDEDVASPISGKWMNPAVWQHIVSSYGGGFAQLVGDVTSTASNVIEGKEQDSSQWPMLKRFYAKPTDERANWARYGKYKKYKEEYDYAREKYSAIGKKDLDPTEEAEEISRFVSRHPKAAAIYDLWEYEGYVEELKELRQDGEEEKY